MLNCSLERSSVKTLLHYAVKVTSNTKGHTHTQTSAKICGQSTDNLIRLNFKRNFRWNTRVIETGQNTAPATVPSSTSLLGIYITVVLLYHSLFCYNMFSTRHYVAAMAVHRLAHAYGISQCKQVLDQQNNELASSNPTSGRHEHGAPLLDRS